MPKTFKTASFLFEYFLLRALQITLTIIPRRIALALGALGGSILWRLGIYRRIVDKNFRHVGLWNEAETARIIRALYRNIGRYAIDFLRPALPMPPHRIRDIDKVEPLLATGKGAIVILAHLGNWELLATVFGKTTGRLFVVAQTMNNTIVDKWLHAKRTASSVTTIYTDQALRKMFEAIRGGGIIAILIDQFTVKHGTPVPFLGKEAKTVRTVAGIVRKTGCTVFSTRAVLRPDGTYDISLTDIAPPDFTGSSEEEAIGMLQRQHNDIVSAHIREFPDHWFGWFHRRFRGYVDYSR